MILGYIGDMGSGKTLSMVRQAYKLYCKGYKIYSNFKLNFPFEYFTLEQITNYANNDTNFINAVFLIDEAHIFLDSRCSMSKRNLAISYFILQTRKRNVWLFYTTQYIHQVDKRLRSATNDFIQCMTKENSLKQMSYTLNIHNISKITGISIKKDGFISNKYYNLYDTNEVIKSV